MSVLNAFSAVGKALKVLTVAEGAIKRAESGEPSESVEEFAMSEGNEKRTVVEEIEVETKNLVERVKQLLHEGNIRTLRVKDRNGKYLVEIPLTVGVLAGGVFAMTAPWLVALSALAGLVVDVKIEIVREVDDESEDAPDDAPGDTSD